MITTKITFPKPCFPKINFMFIPTKAYAESIAKANINFKIQNLITTKTTKSL